MSYFTEIVSAFCVVCVFVGALYMLCPEGKLSKSVKYVLSLVFLVSVMAVAGMGKGEFDFDINFSQKEDISIDQIENLNLKFAFEEILQKNGINFKEIEIFTDKLENGGISINKVIIRSDCEKEKIFAALADITDSIEVEVIDE